MSNTTPLSTGRSEGDARRLSLRGAKRFADEVAIVERNRQFIGRADGQRAAAYEAEAYRRGRSTGGQQDMSTWCNVDAVVMNGLLVVILS
jgi:hypothetical protein